MRLTSASMKSPPAAPIGCAGPSIRASSNPEINDMKYLRITQYTVAQNLMFVAILYNTMFYSRLIQIGRDLLLSDEKSLCGC